MVGATTIAGLFGVFAADAVSDETGISNLLVGYYGAISILAVIQLRCDCGGTSTGTKLFS